MGSSDILGRAIQVTLKNRALWVMGFFVSLSGTALSFFGGGGSSPRRPGGPSGVFTDTDPPLVNLWQELSELPRMQGILNAILCVAVLILFVAAILHIFGRGGLIGGIVQAEAKGQVTLGETLALGTRYFGRMLSVQLLLYAPVAAFALIMFCLVVPSLFLPFLLICLLPLWVILIVSMVIASYVSTLAERAVILDDMTALEGYRHGWALLKKNLASVIAIGAILLVAKFLFGFVSVVLVGVALLPGILALDPETPNMWLLAVSALLLVFLFPLALFISSVITTWDFSAWTMIYRQMTGNRPLVAQPA